MVSSAQASVTSRPAPLPKSQQRHLSDRAIRNLFIFPTLILLIVMNVFPLFYSLYLSFTDYSAIAKPAAAVGRVCRTTVDILTDRAAVASTSAPPASMSLLLGQRSKRWWASRWPCC
jgi:ABC-type sugar transport system permease subunit